MLTFRLHVNGVFLAPKTQVFENGPQSGVFRKRQDKRKRFEYASRGRAFFLKNPDFGQEEA